MDKPEPDYGSGELLQALTEQLEKHEAGEGMTTQELCQTLSLGEEAVRRLLKELQVQGRLESTRVRRMALDGIYRLSPAYLIKKD
jgi:DNA-binding IclR family transcriptional regulator